MAKKRKASASAPAVQKKEGMVEKAGSFAMGIAAKTKVKRFEEWMNAFFKPEESAEPLCKKASIRETAVNFLLLYFPYYIMVFVLYAASTYFMPAYFPAQDASAVKLANPFDSQVAASMLIINPLVSTVNMLAVLLLVFATCKLFGGKASYAKQSYSFSFLFAGGLSILAVLMVAIMAALAIGSAFQPDSTLGLVFSFVVGAAALVLLASGIATIVYGIYQAYLMLKAVHGISGLRTAGAMLAAAALFVAANYALSMVFGSF